MTEVSQSATSAKVRCLPDSVGKRCYRIAKRAFDIGFSLAALVATAPVMAACAVAIKVDDPEGPVIFRQRRVGRGGEEFTMYKLRTMVDNAEDLVEGLRGMNMKDGPVFKVRDDPRVTRVGSVLRKASIDEVPNFVNVLLGQMSVVGPRPALPQEVALYDDHQRQRLAVKPGVTCYWQICDDRDYVPFDQWVESDLRYIREASVLTDLSIIARTVRVVLTAQGS